MSKNNTKIEKAPVKNYKKKTVVSSSFRTHIQNNNRYTRVLSGVVVSFDGVTKREQKDKYNDKPVGWVDGGAVSITVSDGRHIGDYTLKPSSKSLELLDKLANAVIDARENMAAALKTDKEYKEYCKLAGVQYENGLF